MLLRLYFNSLKFSKNSAKFRIDDSPISRPPRHTLNMRLICIRWRKPVSRRDTQRATNLEENEEKWRRESYKRHKVSPALIRGLSATIYARRRARFSNFLEPFSFFENDVPGSPAGIAPADKGKPALSRGAYIVLTKDSLLDREAMERDKAPRKSE